MLKLLRAVIVLAQMNTHIWYNESDVRNGVKGSDNFIIDTRIKRNKKHS